MSFGLFSFVIINVAHRYIRMSSPNLNNLIILGCVLIYISGGLIGIDGENASEKTHERVCQVWDS